MSSQKQNIKLLPKKDEENGRTHHTLLSSVLTLTSWLLLSVALASSNKWLLGYAGFRFPMFMATSHMAGSYLVSSCLTSEGAPTWQLLRQHWTCFLPVAFLYALSICLRNVALIYISVACAQLLVALAPLFVYAFSVVLGVEEVKGKLLVQVCAIAAGAALSVSGSFSHTRRGICLQVAGILCESLRGVVLNAFLRKSKSGMQSIDSLRCLSLPCVIITGGMFGAFEYNAFKNDILSRSRLFYVAFSINVCVAIVFNIVHLHVLRSFKALTMSMTSITKDWLLIALSAVVEGGNISTQFVVGGLLTCITSIFYANYRCRN